MYLRLDEISKQKISTEDVNALSALYADPKYKSLVKLQNNVIIDLENRTFKEAQKEAEFLGIKWARAVQFLLQSEIKRYFYLVTSQNAKGQRKETRSPEDFEDYPDGVPINGEKEEIVR